MTEFDYTNMTPENVRKAANLAAEAIRYLNVATLDRPREVLRDPADVDRILADLETLGQRLPQLLDQLGARMTAETKAGRVRVNAPGAKSPSTETLAVAASCRYLEEGITGAEMFQTAVHDARQITATLAPAPEPREGDAQ